MNASAKIDPPEDPSIEPLALAARIEPLIFAQRVVGLFLTAGPDHPYPGGSLLLRALGVAVNRERAPGIRFRKISTVAAARDRNWVDVEADFPDKSVFQAFGFLTHPTRDETAEHPHLTAFINQAIARPDMDPIGAWSRSGFLVGARGPAARQLIELLASGSETADLAVWSDPWLRTNPTVRGLSIAKPSMIDAYASAQTKTAEPPPPDLAERLIATKKFSAVKRVGVLEARASRTRYNALFLCTPSDGQTPAFTATVEQLEDWLVRLAQKDALKR